MDALKQIYNKYFGLGVNSLYNIAREKGVKVSRKQVSDFVKQQSERQVFRQAQRQTKGRGHIVSNFPKHDIQIDILDMSRWSRFNKGFKYILVIIDVFTRKGYAYPLKKKAMNYVVEAMEEFFTNEFVPETIVSDSDASFSGKAFQDLMRKYKIVHRTVTIGDHKALGVIDRFIKTLKKKIILDLERNKTQDWLSRLSGVIKAYNNTPHSGVLELKPKSIANNEEKRIQIADLNRLKAEKQVKQLPLRVGDKVRVLVKKEQFQREYDPVYSRDVFIVKKVNPTTALLEGFSKPTPRKWLLVVPPSSRALGKDKAKRSAQQIRRLQREGLQ